jgi:hypothetical protein
VTRALVWGLAGVFLCSCAARRFEVEERDGVAWFVDPGGRRFFSLGVNVVDQGYRRPTTTPSYVAARHYAGPEAWADATIGRLRAWNFTTIGGWGDAEAFLGSAKMNLVLTPVLAAGMEAGAPWLDMWDPEILARVEAIARERIIPVRDYRGLLGFYIDNELGWWNAALLKETLKQKAGSGQRRRLVALLRDTYGGSWDAFLRDFDPEGAGSFDDLDRGGGFFLRPGGDGIRAARRFLGLIAERYYEILESIVRRHDAGALVLGDRYQSFYYPEVARAAARHVDVVSTNLNAHWIDGTFARFFLHTLHELTGKPILVSEFYMAAAENRSGNPNSHGFFPIAPTQRARAEGFRRTVTALLDLPYVVGADWFQYYDEPPGGRFDGEDYNFGLVDIEDRPYEELVAAARGVDAPRLHARASLRGRADATGGVPRAPADPLERFEPNVALMGWDRERGFVPPVSRFPMADVYLAWDADALWLGLVTIDGDTDEAAYYRDGRVAEIDRMEWVVEVGGRREPVRLRLGAEREPSGAPPDTKVMALSGKELSVRTVAALRIPAASFGGGRLEAGGVIRLSSVLTSPARAYRTEWRGEFRLAR